MKAIVVGAGVAGPVAAMALQQAGLEVVVHESHAPADGEVGSWLTVTPNGLDALAAVGSLHLAREIGLPTRANIMLGATGRELGRLPLGRPLADGTPALTMKRTRLAAVLAQECSRRGIEIRYGSGLVAADLTPSGGVRAVFADGTAEDADLLVGADGVHSTTRRLVDPKAPNGRYVGLVNFGGLTTAGVSGLDDAEAEPECWHFVFGRRAFFGWHATPGGDVVWFVNEPRPQVSPDERRQTTEPEWRTHLADLFADDAGPAAPLIRAGVLELAGDNTHDLGHVPTWHRGPLLVIGDAAHAPAPSSGQGASIAMEDGVVLARSCVMPRTSRPRSRHTRACAAHGWRRSSPRVRAAAAPRHPGRWHDRCATQPCGWSSAMPSPRRASPGCTTTASTGSRRWRRRHGRRYPWNRAMRGPLRR